MFSPNDIEVNPILFKYSSSLGDIPPSGPITILIFLISLFDRNFLIVFSFSFVLHTILVPSIFSNSFKVFTSVITGISTLLDCSLASFNIFLYRSSFFAKESRSVLIILLCDKKGTIRFTPSSVAFCKIKCLPFNSISLSLLFVENK